MVHCVTHQMHQRIGNILDDVLIHLGMLAHHLKVNVLAQLPGDIEHNAVHLLEQIGQRHHPHGHDYILQIRGNLGHLPRRLVEIGKVQARNFQIGILQYHGFRDNQFTDEIHQLIHLIHIDTDECILGPLLLILCQLLGPAGFLGLDNKVTGSHGSLFCLLLLRRLLRLGLYGLYAGFQINLRGMIPAEIESQQKFFRLTLVDIHLLNVIPDADQIPDLSLRALGLEQNLEAILQNGLSAGFIGDDILRRVEQIFRNLLHCVDHLVGMDIGHNRLRGKSDIHLVKAAGIRGHGGYVKLLGLLMHVLRHQGILPHPFFDGLQKSIQLFDNALRISIGCVPVADLIHLFGNEIRHFQHMLHQFKVRHMLGMGLSQIKENVFQLMGNGSDVVEHHDARRTLYGMHGAEYFVDAVLIKAIRILLVQHHFLQLLQ